MIMAANVHDEINMQRLVWRLEKSVSDSQWTAASCDVWIKAQGMLQKVKYARKLLRTVELDDVNPTPKSMQRYDDFKTKLDRIDTFMQAVEKRTAPKHIRPEPILPHIPPPNDPEPEPPQLQRAVPLEAMDLLGEDPSSASLPTDNLLFSASDAVRTSFSSSVSPPLTTLLPPSFPPSATTSTTTAVEPRFLQNSTAVQRELSDQLALMATQLKRNAIHFSESLARDQAVVEETEKKLEGNYGYMQKTRVRTRDLRGKTGSTTCLAMVIVLVAMFIFMLMVSLIRLS
ncbi:hypothetical protein B0H10DRAFT_2051188 [Mycena sp. CBHHK59/15]|nr:hypothetical protein B0H10DRAFT_2051188 [Mycena sp. CBHHK59/15]